MLHRAKSPCRTTIDDVLRLATANSASDANHFSRDNFVLEALYCLPEFGLSPDPLLQAVDDFLADSPDVVPIALPGRNFRYTTPPVLREERKLLRVVRRLRRRRGLIVRQRYLDRTLKNYPYLNEEQVIYVRHLTQATRAIRLGQGLAGTGKTTAVRAAVEAFERQGYRVIGAAPTGRAAEVLSASIGIECMTLTKFLGDYRFPVSAQIKHHARQLTRAARRRRTRRFRQPRPQKLKKGKTVILVDEAGMISTRHTRMLAEHAERSNATICLIGDAKQLPAVEGTSPFKSLGKRMQHPTLETIRRQKEEWARTAARALANGRVGIALALYAEHKLLKVCDDFQSAIRKAALDWTAEGLNTPERAIILTSTNDAADEANHLCQQHCLNAGCLRKNRWLDIVDESDSGVYSARAHVGDRVLFTKNSYGKHGYGVDNGSLGTIMEINRIRRTILVRMDHGRTVLIPVRRFPHIRLGYAMTTYKGQGGTFPTAYCVVGGPMQNLPASYVQLSRARRDTHIYTTQELLDASLKHIHDSPLAEEMRRRPDLRLASDLLEAYPQPEVTRRKAKIRQVRIPEPPESEATNTPTPEPTPMEASPLQALPASEEAIANPTSQGFKQVAEEHTDARASGESAASRPENVSARAVQPRSSAAPTRHPTQKTPVPPAKKSVIQRNAATREKQPQRVPEPVSAEPSEDAKATSPAGPEKATGPENTFVFGKYQRMRFPEGRYYIEGRATLQASYIDGREMPPGHRSTPQPGRPLRYCSRSLFAERVEPYCSDREPLQALLSDGRIQLRATGSGDYIDAFCPRNEVWSIIADDSLGLVSVSDDIHEAIPVLNKPGVIRQLKTLDDLEWSLGELIPSDRLFFSLFAHCRRAISWRIPWTDEPTQVTKELLGQLCNLLFEDPQARLVFDCCSELFTEMNIKVWQHHFREAFKAFPTPSDPHLFNRLARVVYLGEDTPAILKEAAQTAVKQCPEDLQDSLTYPFLQTIDSLKLGIEKFREETFLPVDKTEAIMRTLYEAAGRPMPSHAQFLRAIESPYAITPENMHSIPALQEVVKFCCAYLGGCEQLAKMIVQRFAEDFGKSFPQS